MEDQYVEIRVGLLEDLLDSLRLEIDERVASFGEDYRPHVLETLRKSLKEGEDILNER